MPNQFLRSRLFGFYEFELSLLAEAVVLNCDRLFDVAPPKAEGSYLRCLNEINALIAGLLSDAARIGKLLTDSPRKRKDESQAEREFRRQRCQYLMTLVAGLELGEILNSKIRNTLEHYDAYLDHVNRRFTRRDHGDATVACSNLVMSDWQHIPGETIYPIRVYIANERKFYNMDWSVDIGAIRAQAKSLADRLRKNASTQTLHQVGAMCVKLVDKK